MHGEYKRYLFEYRHGGSEWALELVATSPQDAQERLKTLPWAHLKGEIVAKSGIPGGGILGRIAHLFQR
jgi:hypothetical protein